MLTYDAKALILIEAGETNMRVQEYEPAQNKRAQIEALDLLQEIRDQAAMKIDLHKARIIRMFNRKVNIDH